MKSVVVGPNVANQHAILLCHAEVTNSPYKNVALQRYAAQSSTDGPHYASLAVDGDKTTTFSNGGCSSTMANDTSPWWFVDLGYQTYVYGVNLTSTTDYTSGLLKCHAILSHAVLATQIERRIDKRDQLN
jgi:hypothetical protein